jgi:hypothetical protein
MLLVLGQGDGEPPRLGADEYVHARTDTRVVNKSSHGDMDKGALADDGIEERAADPAMRVVMVMRTRWPSAGPTTRNCIICSDGAALGVEAEYSDFGCSAPTCKELILVARVARVSGRLSCLLADLARLAGSTRSEVLRTCRRLCSRKDRNAGFIGFYRTPVNAYDYRRFPLKLKHGFDSRRERQRHSNHR